MWGSPWSIFSGVGEGDVEVSSKIRSLFKSSLITLLCQTNPAFASLDYLDLLIRSWSDCQSHPKLCFFLDQKQIVPNLKGNQEICSAEKRLSPMQKLISSAEKRGRRTERQVAASEAERVPSPQVVFTRVGHSVSDYAVRFGYPLMLFRCPLMHFYFPNPNDFYAVSCRYAII